MNDVPVGDRFATQPNVVWRLGLALVGLTTAGCSLLDLDALQDGSGGAGGSPSSTSSTSSNGGEGLSGGGGQSAGGGPPQGEVSYLLAIGGSDAERTARAEVYVARVGDDGELGAWRSTSPLPVARFAHGAAVIGRRVYVAGGINGPNLRQVYHAELGDDGELGGWVETTLLPTPLTEVGLATDGQRLYVAGGGAPITNGVWVATPTSDGAVGEWVATAPLPAPRWRHSAFLADGGLVVLGGSQATDIQWPQGFFVGATTADGTIASHDDYALVEGLRWSCATYARGRIYVVGGNDLDSAAGDVVRFATYSKSAGLGPWSTTAGTSPRIGHGCVEHQGFLYVVGGDAGHQAAPPTDQVSRARIRDDGSLDAFTDAPALPSARSYLKTVVVSLPLDPSDL